MNKYSAKRVPLPLLAIAAAQLVLHIVTAPLYPRELNEYYFLDLSRHLDWGYVDVAPLGPLLFHVGDWLGGGSLWGTRLFSAVAAALTVYLAGLIAAALDGGRFAQLLAAVAVGLVSFLVRGWSSMSLFAYEPVFWAASSYLLILILKQDRPALWPLLGVTLGLGILLKPTLLLFVGGLGVGLLLSARHHLRRRQFWLGAAALVIVVSPFVMWMAAHHWVSISFGASRRLPMSWVMSLLTPTLWMLPTTLPLWALGLHYFARRPEASALRALAWMFASAWAAVLATHAKSYYLIPLHIPLIAAGAVQVGEWRWRWARVAMLATVTVAGVAWLPLGIPFLEVHTFDRYAKYAWPAMGPKRAQATNGMFGARQIVYGRRYGWEETAQKLAAIYARLPAAERQQTVILAQRYPTAAALNFYNPAQGLPRVISGDVQYWLWGPGALSGETALLIGFSDDEARALYREVQPVIAPLVTPPDPGELLTISVCRGLKAPLAQVWPSLLRLGELIQPNGVLAPLR
jgi:4-amino-4-deoxy-L-arabinose transferase-like glycosyltransferase